MDSKDRTIVEYVADRPGAPVKLLTIRKQSVRIDMALLRAKCEVLVKDGYLNAATRDANKQLQSVVIGPKAPPAVEKPVDAVKAALKMLKIDDVIMKLQYRIEVCEQEGMTEKAARYRAFLEPIVAQEFPDGPPADLAAFMTALTAKDHDGPSVRQRLLATEAAMPDAAGTNKRFVVKARAVSPPSKKAGTPAVQKPSRRRSAKT